MESVSTSAFAFISSIHSTYTGAVESLRVTFTDPSDETLSLALVSSNRDGSATVEQLLSVNKQVRTDAELARALQAAGASGVPLGGDDEMPELASLAQPVMEGLATAGSAAKAAVEYIATEISYAATGGSARLQQATSSPRRHDDESSRTGHFSTHGSPYLRCDASKQTHMMQVRCELYCTPKK